MIECIQLRIRTEGTFGQTFCPISRAIQRLQAIGCTAAGIVDRDATWYHVPWFKACKAAGIRPLLGVEMIVSDDESTQRMWFLARTKDGLSELYRATSKAFQQPIATKIGSYPRLFRLDVREMSEDIFKFAGDIMDAEFLTEVGAYLDLNPVSRIVNVNKLGLAKTTGLKLVETSDNVFAFPEDKEVFEFAARGRLKATPQYILETLKHQDTAEWIANECAGLELPIAPMIRAEGNLEEICREGIRYRKLEDKWTKEYEDRLQYELGLIRSKDFESYFLVVADMMHYAKSKMLCGAGRGSSSGSLVCYLTRITEVDPLPNNLLFQRFIDPTRTDLPDIDTDLNSEKRFIVFDYMAEKYGAENTAHIGTISQFKAKSALVQVCKALKIPPFATAAVKVAMIERALADSRTNNCLEDTFKDTEPGRNFVAAYPQAVIASRLEGHASHTGVHAAGLLICNDEITNYCTVTSEGIAQIDKYSAELLGLLKIDVLGLRTLDVLEDIGVDIDWYNLPLDDPKAIEIFNSGRFCGIFQFEGDAMRQLSGQINFKSIIDVDAITALARPGPFGSGIVKPYIERHNGAPYESIHPKIAKMMSQTYGFPLYQEQTLEIVREIGGFSWEETSFVRKAISKRQGKEFFQTFYPKFRDGAMQQGIPEHAALEIWTMIDSMGSWQMNHCVAKGTLVRITVNNSNLPMLCPIEELYKKYVEMPSRWVRQNKSMPRLLSLFPDGRGYPQRAKMIYKNGKKNCVELKFDDETTIKCTPDHRFIIDGKWKACRHANIGAKFTSLQRDASGYGKRGNAAKGKHWGELVNNNRSGSNNVGYINGMTVAVDGFRKLKKNSKKGCEDCGKKTSRMEVHHNDFDAGRIRPHDLSWLCSGCHKRRHYANGSRRKVFKKGYEKAEKILVKIKDIGKLETYDIEMLKHFNYVIDGGIVSHNSHTYSYAVLSVWCAFAKANFPIEFAAATLRSAKSEDSAIELLRELANEGIEYVPFDLTLSEVNWAVKDGLLVGGFLSLKGIGESKAAKLVEARDAGTLTAKQIKDIKESINSFGNIFPFKAKYQKYYDDPEAHGIAGKVWLIKDIDEGIPHGEERVFLGELIHKNVESINSDVNKKKRNGKVETGPQDYLNLRFRDDTGVIGGRIGRWDYSKIGRDIAEKVPIGAHFLIRAKYWNGYRYSFVTKIKRLDTET